MLKLNVENENITVTITLKIPPNKNVFINIFSDFTPLFATFLYNISYVAKNVILINAKIIAKFFTVLIFCFYLFY